MQKKTKRILTATAILLACAAACGLFLLGVIKINTPPAERYPVRGADVSEYQGEIDWAQLETQGMAFAFIKATEGSGYTDPRFAENWACVGQTRILAGAYHFFSFDSPAAAQAESFIATVDKQSGMLPPVVDVELYGEYKQSPPDAEAVRAELAVMLDALETHYGAKPILVYRGSLDKLRDMALE